MGCEKLETNSWSLTVKRWEITRGKHEVEMGLKVLFPHQ